MGPPASSCVTAGSAAKAHSALQLMLGCWAPTLQLCMVGAACREGPVRALGHLGEPVTPALLGQPLVRGGVRLKLLLVPVQSPGNAVHKASKCS